MTPQIVADVIAHIDDGHAHMNLAYTDTDPYAITLTPDETPDRIWVFDRELLRQGIHADTAAPVGDGDIRISADSPWLFLRMVSPHGSALLRLFRPPVVDFLNATFELVPAGTEPAACDTELDTILDGTTWA